MKSAVVAMMVLVGSFAMAQGSASAAPAAAPAAEAPKAEKPCHGLKGAELKTCKKEHKHDKK